MNDVFTPDAFKNHQLTDSFNLAPYKPGRIQSMGLFQTKPVYRTHVDIEYQYGKLSLVQTQARGNVNGNRVTLPKRALKSFKIPHLPLLATMTPDDLPDIRSFGTADGRELFNNAVAQLLIEQRQYMEATIEYHMAGALRGHILDADGSTIYDLNSEFNIAREYIDFDADAHVLSRRLAILTRFVQDRLGANTYSQLHVLCGDILYDRLWNNEEVQKAYDRPREGQFLRDSHVRDSFIFRGIIFENYRGSVGSTNFVGAREGIVIPKGVPGLFMRYNGPADTTDAVGRQGKEYVVTREFLPHNTGVELRIQANPLILCTRPGVLATFRDTTSGDS